MKNPTSWGKVADWYDEYLKDPDSYQTQVILPHFLRIVDPTSDMHVLDLACGQGFFSVHLAYKNTRVTGVDISKELVKIASAKALKLEEDKKIQKGKLDFHVAPAHKLEFLKDKTFDRIICVLAAQNIKELDQMFTECARVLKPGGKLILVLNHPAFRVPQSSDWHYDEASKRQGRVVYSYMSEKQIKIEMNPGKKDRKEDSASTISFQRPLQVYVKWLSKHNLAVTRLEEWISHKKSQFGPRSVAEDTARHEIPMFMCIEATLF